MKFNVEKSPRTFAYVLENDTINRRCNCCGNVVLKETFVKDYPYQCLSCDENLYEMETHLGVDHTDEELEELCCNARDLLLLDTEVRNETD